MSEEPKNIIFSIKVRLGGFGGKFGGEDV